MKARIPVFGLSLTLLVGPVQALVSEHQCPLRDRHSFTLPGDVELPHDNSLIYGVQLAENSAGFASELEAVRAATNRFNPVSISLDTEFIGAVLRKNGRYFYSAQRGHHGRDRVSLHLFYPGDYELVAFWHTHGAAAAERVFFSDFDTRVVKETGKPFYLADHSGELKVFRPGSHTLSAARAKRLGLPRQAGFARGEKLVDEFGKLVLICTSLVQG